MQTELIPKRSAKRCDNHFHLVKTLLFSEAYLKPSRTSIIERFCKNS